MRSEVNYIDIEYQLLEPPVGFYAQLSLQLSLQLNCSVLRKCLPRFTACTPLPEDVKHT
jgi:hypothetical protein